MPHPAKSPIKRDRAWKLLAGVLLGLPLALGCSAVFAEVITGVSPPIRAQLTMWVVMPIWLGVISGCFAFTSGKRAWRVLGAANLVVFGIVALSRLC